MVSDKVNDLSDMDCLNPESKELGVSLFLANWQGSVAAQEMAIKEGTVLIQRQHQKTVKPGKRSHLSS